MELKDGEKIEVIEDISENAIAELIPVFAEIEETKNETLRLKSEMDMLIAKGEYLTKLKWSLFDKHHPKTNSDCVTAPPGRHLCRKYFWDEKKVALVSHPEGEGASNMLHAILDALQRGGNPNKPKRPEPAPAPAAKESAESPSIHAASAETA